MFSFFSTPSFLFSRKKYAGSRGRYWLAIQLHIVIGEFLDGDKLVLINIGKVLPRVCCRPPNFDGQDARGMAQSEVLLQGASAKGTVFSYRAIYGTRSVAVVLD